MDTVRIISTLSTTRILSAEAVRLPLPSVNVRGLSAAESLRYLSYLMLCVELNFLLLCSTELVLTFEEINVDVDVLLSLHLVYLIVIHVGTTSL